MSNLVEAIGIAFVVGGMVLMLLGSVGIITLPDFYARTHATSKVDTVGVILVLFGLAILRGIDIDAAKLFLAAIFVALSNPVASHAMARAARRSGLSPWTLPSRPEGGGKSRGSPK